MELKKPVLAVDFDETISDLSMWPHAGNPKDGVKDALTQLIKKYEIVIYTCRTNLNQPNRDFHISEIKRFMVKYAIPYDRLDLGLEGKIVATAYIDDRAIPFENNWPIIAKALLY